MSEFDDAAVARLECRVARRAGWDAARAQVLPALQAAEAFIAGFEDDELQEGVPELLASLRAAIAATAN